MALLDTLIPNASADIVAVFDENFSQVFENARPVKAMVKEYAKVMEHPIETGATITDHRVIQPIEIELSMILASDDYRSVYQQIRQLYLDATLLTVQTKTATYENMLISEMPHDEDPDQFDSVILALRMKEVDFVTATFGTLPASKVANPVNASTTQSGEKQSKAVTTRQSILAESIFGRSQ